MTMRLESIGIAPRQFFSMSSSKNVGACSCLHLESLAEDQDLLRRVLKRGGGFRILERAGEGSLKHGMQDVDLTVGEALRQTRLGHNRLRRERPKARVETGL
jgi:hypothetical protein